MRTTLSDQQRTLRGPAGKSGCSRQLRPSKYTRTRTADQATRVDYARGFVFFGVADDRADAEAVERYAAIVRFRA